MSTSTSTSTLTATRNDEALDLDLPIKPRRNLIDWIGIPIVAFLVVLFISDLFRNPNWEWGVVGTYLFDPFVLEGLRNTIFLTLLSGVTGTLFGLVIAMMRLAKSPLLRGISTAFVGFMRAIPALVLLLLIYFTGALFPELGFGIPFTDVMFYYIPLNDLITQFAAAWIGLTLIMGSHTGEIFRGGVSSVSAGQSEAAQALGMGPWHTFSRIVMPQMIRVSIPALANELISLFKNTSLVSVIGYMELLTVVQSIYGRTYQTIPMLIVACIWYLGIVSLAMIGQYLLEKRFGRGFGVGAN